MNHFIRGVKHIHTKKSGLHHPLCLSPKEVFSHTLVQAFHGPGAIILN